jgi:hypothetical protein
MLVPLVSLWALLSLLWHSTLLRASVLGGRNLYLLVAAAGLLPTLKVWHLSSCLHALLLLGLFCTLLSYTV